VDRSNSARRVPVIGVAGGTGSGKTTITSAIAAAVGDERLTLIPHDSYYFGWGHLPPEERALVNFDHPASLETSLLVGHIDRLAAGEPVGIPIYDFVEHRRLERAEHVEPRDIIIVEGVLVLSEPSLRERMAFKIYVDTDDDLRFIRRLQRDVQERGRTVESVIEQYLRTVRPMHLEFVEPSRRHADVIIPEGGFNERAIDMVCNQIRAMIGLGRK
jgi:uridine kinase